MAKMFESKTDLNGVRLDTNAHPSSDYEPRRLKGYDRHMMMNTAGEMYVDDKPPTLEHEVGDQVLRGIGSRTGTMTFNSLLARGEKR